MNTSLKTLLTWSSWCAISAIVIASIIYSAWAFVALVMASVLLLSAEDYHLINAKAVVNK